MAKKYDTPKSRDEKTAPAEQERDGAKIAVKVVTSQVKKVTA